MAYDFSNHKLSGYLLAILSPATSPEQTLAFGTRCYVSEHNAAFETECGIVLTAPQSGNLAGSAESSGAMRKKKRMGMVNGSMSIVHQIHALVSQNCLKIDARVVDGGVDGWVVVLVDVYLRDEAVLGGWQCPRIGVVAGAIFRHLSCDWAARSLFFSRKVAHEDTKRCLKNGSALSACHVFGCIMHHDVGDSSKIFDLNEIFRSLRSVTMKVESDYSRLKPADDSCESGIWDLSDDILLKILTPLSPIELFRTSATCRHLRSVSSSIMPCMKLRLFPHQQAAIDWMLQRERNTEEFLHPLYKKFSTEDGITYYVNTVSGEIVNGVGPTIKDFSGGMFCDEPGLGKTITALSLILKTQGTLPNPPPDTKVIWCTHNGYGYKRCGYYELHGNTAVKASTPGKTRIAGEKARSHHMTSESILHDEFEHASPKRAKLAACHERDLRFNDSCSTNHMRTPADESPVSAPSSLRNTRSVSNAKKNRLHAFVEESSFSRGRKSSRNSHGKKQISNVQTAVASDTWVQCDACNKWRKLASKNSADVNAAWFCSMNTDPCYKRCSVPEESWDNHSTITYLPGYCTKGTSGCLENNVTYFVNVLRENSNLINSETKKALKWLANLSPESISEIETRGLRGPFVSTSVVSEAQGFHKILQAFGLVKSVKKGVVSWHYPSSLEDLAFDVGALRAALCKPLDSVRLYMSTATLIVVPANLVEHWRTQIEKHVRQGQLRVFVWADCSKPAAHSLAWDHDLVITTFNRLSSEWNPHKKSVLMQVHWRRIILDEGHTLGASLSLTNKLQMAISLVASSRWILTGTPTPNTPSSQLSHLLPILKFLHEEAYGKKHKSWEDGILRPFEAEMEEGRLRLLELLNRCMISARKTDLKTIPPCIKKVTYLDFTENHARSYNELVVTVRRNILMADWSDPSHVESLLNPKQWKFRGTTIKNVRLSCCVAGQIQVTSAGMDIRETMDILAANGLDPASEDYAFIKYNLSYGGNCFRCKEWCRLPIITPCRHLLCLDCVAMSSEKCTVPGCGNHYEMQTPDLLTRPENPNPKWPVPKDLIALQPSYKQDDWHPDWQSTSSSKVTYLVDRLVELQNGNVTNHDMDRSPGSRNLESDNNHLDKVIIFSQFLEHIHVIQEQLTFAGIGFASMYSPMHSFNKIKALEKFQYDANCIALLMDGSAALGLDLSFVTHVYLMEPIWDRSMEEQVISRAHRMGATRPINVETLAMRGTIEEQMLQFLQDVDGCRRHLRVGNGIFDNEGSRTHRSLHEFAESSYLSRLTSVWTNH